MKKVEERELNRRFRSQHGLVTTAEARVLGLSSEQIKRRVDRGDWQRLPGGVLRAEASPADPLQALHAACLAGGPGAMASHQSAAWLWGFWPVPDRPSLVVPRGGNGRLPGVEVHRLVQSPPRVSFQHNVPCTDPLRTLIDLAGVIPVSRLDEAVDRALASRLVTVAGLEAELERSGGRGRTGTGVMRAALRRRGLIGAPHPSVLESRTLRLLAWGGVRPVAVEMVAGEDGRYRLDMALVEWVAMEADGFTYHATPEQKAEDERRRNRIRLGGMTLLVYTWRDITYDGRRVLAEVHQAIAAAPAQLRTHPTTKVSW